MYQEVPSYSYQLPPPTGSEICTEVEVEDDLECNCGCQLTCNDFQHFDPVSCQCNCNNTAEMQGCISQGSHKEWDQESCLCRCTEKNKACSFGYVYDAINTCRLVWHFRYDLYQWLRCFFQMCSTSTPGTTCLSSSYGYLLHLLTSSSWSCWIIIRMWNPTMSYVLSTIWGCPDLNATIYLSSRNLCQTSCVDREVFVGTTYTRDIWLVFS